MSKTRFRTVMTGITVLGLLLFVSVWTQAAPPHGPLHELQEQIDILKAQIETITDIVDENAADIDMLQDDLATMETLRVSTKQFIYPVVSYADCGPEPDCQFVDVFETPLTITTTIAGPMVITFSAYCEVKGGDYVGIAGDAHMLINVQLDGERQEPPGEVDFIGVENNDIDRSNCSYGWAVSDVPAGTHTVQVNFRVTGGVTDGYARSWYNTLWVIHER